MYSLLSLVHFVCCLLVWLAAAFVIVGLSGQFFLVFFITKLFNQCVYMNMYFVYTCSTGRLLYLFVAVIVFVLLLL